jgi:hypothetical protein
MTKMNSKGAMEMSVGTIVTIVLLMSVLVLGLFLVQRVFSSGTSAIDSIDDQVQNEIQKLFSEEGRTLAVYPSSRDITIKSGDTPKGFAFSIKNKDTEPADYTYEVFAQPSFDFSGKCGSTMTEQRANSYLLLSSGNINNLGPGEEMELPQLVRFSVPESSPPCTIPYKLEVTKVGGSSQGTDVYVTIK